MTDRTVPAPDLREVAQVWWDLDQDPAVTWDADGRVYDLVPASDGSSAHRTDRRLALLRLAEPAADPRQVAAVLASGLASCDFPPTDEQASPGRVRATLRAAGLSTLPVVEDGS